MSKFGWSYPPGAENDPNAPYNQDYDDSEESTIETDSYIMETDPYGALVFVIGTADDFWCFDYDTNHDTQMIRLHATINSETGSFIMDAEPPVEIPFDEAIDYATALVDQAQEWCAENGIQHDTIGWNQEPDYFIKSIRTTIKQTPNEIL